MIDMLVRHVGRCRFQVMLLILVSLVVGHHCPSVNAPGAHLSAAAEAAADHDHARSEQTHLIACDESPATSTSVCFALCLPMPVLSAPSDDDTAIVVATHGRPAHVRPTPLFLLHRSLLI